MSATSLLTAQNVGTSLTKGGRMMSCLYLVECPKCHKDSLFYSLCREDWICQTCGYDIGRKGDDNDVPNLQGM